MERQAKDGTFYQQVGQDEWVPVTRQDKQGNVYKKVGEDAWAIITEDAPKEATAGDKAMSALEGYAKSSSMGTLPYLQAGVENTIEGIGNLKDKAASAVGLDGLMSQDAQMREQGFDVPAQSSYAEKVDQMRQRSQGIKEKAPGYHWAGEVAGFLTPGAVVSKGVGMAGKALGIVGAAKTAPLMARLASQSGRLATEGAIFGAAYTPDTGFSDIGARAEAAGTGAAFGAIMPPAMYAGGKALGAVAKAPGWAGKKILSSMGGVKEEVIERYLQNPERIRSAKTFDELYETTTKIVGQLGDDLDNAKIDFDSAKKHLDEVAEGIKTSRVEGRDAALEQVSRAKALLDEAFKSQKAGLTSKASPSNVEPLVSDALGNLKKKVSTGSKEAFEALGDEVVSVSQTYDDLINSTKQLAERGSDSAGKAVGKLQQYGQLIFGKGQTGANGEIKLPAKEIKRIIQDIDNDVTSWNLSGGSFDDAYNASLKSLRKALDTQLKASSPDYAAKMASVADDAKLLGQASERFGKPDRALSRLGNLERPAAKYDKEVLQSLAKKEGGELPQVIDEMTKAQRTLKSPTRLEDVKRSLPEASALREAEMKAAVAKRMAKPNIVKETIKKNAAAFKLRSAEQKLKAQKEVFNRLKSFGEQGAENKLQQVARGRKYAEKQLQELSKYADEDLVEAVKAAQDAAAFDKTMFSGSRNVNLWAMLGALGQSATGKGGVGAATGGVFGGPMGMAVGATIGALMDNYGPRVTKQILDGVIKIKGPVSELAIMKMKVPDNVKADLAKQFRMALVAERAANAAKSAGNKIASENPKEEKPKGEEKWARDGFEKVIQNTTDQAKVERYKQLKEEFLKSSRTRRALVSLSDLKPGTKAYENALKELEQEGGN